MLQVFTGRFHPDLEDALVDHLREAKALDPLAPIAVLVPSASLCDQVRRLLAIERGLSLLNVHVLSFHQLALRLSDEMRVSGESTPVRVADALLFEQLVRHLIRTRLSGLTPLQHIGHSSGTWAALWSTIRDLKDGGVDPVAAMRGLDEGCFDRTDEEWLRALFALHAAVKEAAGAFEVGTPDDLAASLLPYVPRSPFLTSLRRMVYYGFYDLTQVQLSLFETVSVTVPTTLFFPLEEGSAYRFARRFFERHIQPKATSSSVLSGVKTYPTPSLSISSVIGVEEELASACRTILDLCETNGYRFQEIGVVARTLDPYRTVLREVFDRHCVPFMTTAGRPLIHEPLCKVLLQLASLPANDFYRTAMLDVIGSPLYCSSVASTGSASYRPEQWNAIVSTLHITHGRHEWKRLQRASRSAPRFGEDADEAESGPPLNFEPDVIALCWKLVSQLLEECAALPEQGSIGRLLDAFRNLVARHFRKPDIDLVEAGDPQAARLQSTWDAIERIWSLLLDLDAIPEEMGWAQFVELLAHALERSTVPLHQDASQGVRVLDAMAARGLSFKALFVLGLNEKIFPRYIREDPFLRDRHRRVLDATLGFKIDEKLGGYDEEALLFTLLRQAATHRLYLSYQRADEQGRQLAASAYIAESAARPASPPWPIDSIPRRLTDRVARRPTLPRFLPPAQLAQWMAMQGHDPAGLMEATARDAGLFSHAAEALQWIEDNNAPLTPFDGQTGPLPSHWSRVLQRGIAPTPLQRYASCPFQYFAAEVLRLEPIRLPAAQMPDARVLGMLCHAALRRCYESLLRAGWPEHSVPDDRISRYIGDAVSDAAADCEHKGMAGHYLLWELAKEQIAALVAATVADDQARYRDEPYRPVAFEVEATGTLPFVMPQEPIPVKVHGRVDRIDRHRDSGAIRIVDYKYKTGSAMKAADNKLRQSAARGYRLQPPLYACLDLPQYGTAHEVEFLFVAPGWSPQIAHRIFETGDWSSESNQTICRTLSGLMDGIRGGRFFILPDEYCKTCEYRVACRREHQATWWRSYQSTEVNTLRAIRGIRINDE
ncbi:MAG TPA: PD-(D/E)XK nuclease family protein [Nitrospira sp.]|nr:PD-(D/E)XK nuclease family protein [Nitrospira sp.]